MSRLRTFSLGNKGWVFNLGEVPVAMGEYGQWGFTLTEEDGTETEHPTAMVAYGYLSAKIRDLRGDQDQTRAIG